MSDTSLFGTGYTWANHGERHGRNLLDRDGNVLASIWTNMPDGSTYVAAEFVTDTASTHTSLIEAIEWVQNRVVGIWHIPLSRV